jgi:general secretion pathway protein G
MIAIFIVGTLAAIAVPVSQDYYYKAQVVRATADIRVMEKEIALFKVDLERYPNDLAEIARDGFLDPWGYPYQYLNVEDFGK